MKCWLCKSSIKKSFQRKWSSSESYSKQAGISVCLFLFVSPCGCVRLPKQSTMQITNFYILLYKCNTNNFIFMKITTPQLGSKMFLFSSFVWIFKNTLFWFWISTVFILKCSLFRGILFYVFLIFGLASKKVKMLSLILKVWEYHFKRTAKSNTTWIVCSEVWFT